MSQRLYLLRCSNCHFKKLTDGSDLANFVEVKTCVDCSGTRRFKCPQCGYLLKAVKANVETKTKSQKEIEKIREQEKLKKQERQEERRRRLKVQREAENTE